MNTATTARIPLLALAAAFCLAPLSAAAGQQDSRRARREARPPANLAGTIKTATAPSKLLGESVDYATYLPPGYDAPENKNKKWPTLVFLHGLFESYDRFIGRGGAEMLDSAIKKGDIRPLIAVVPNGGFSFFVDSFDGKKPYARFFFEEFLPHVDSTYRTDSRREARVLMGSSMGGAGALRYAFTRGDVFAGVAAHSAAIMPKTIDDASPRAKRTLGFIEDRFGAVFGSPVDPDAYRRANPLTVADDSKIDPRIKIYFDCGDEDRYEFDEGCRALHSSLKALCIRHESKVRPGGHGWDYLRDAMPDGLKFLESALKAAEAPSSRPAAAESRPAPK